ncbi:MAG: hypothetical protein ACRCTJ_06135 [Brevinema sp.]
MVIRAIYFENIVHLFTTLFRTEFQAKLSGATDEEIEQAKKEKNAKSFIIHTTKNSENIVNENK